MSGREFVVLKGGLTLPVAPVLLALDLERRGVRLALDGGDNVVVVGPPELLTEEDRASIRRWKPHLLAIVTYDADAHEHTGSEAR